MLENLDTFYTMPVALRSVTSYMDVILRGEWHYPPNLCVFDFRQASFYVANNISVAAANEYIAS